MKELLAKIAQSYKENGLNDLSNVSDEKRFLYLYATFHYYYGDEDYYYDVREHTNYTLGNNNFAQGVFEEDTFDERVLDVLVPYYISEGENFEKRIAKYRANTVAQMLDNMSSNIYDLAANKHIINDYWDKNPDGDTKIVIRVITNYCPDYETRMAIKDEIEKIPARFKGMSFEIVFGEEIKNDITAITTEKPFVEKGKVVMERANGYVEYGPEGSIITNIKASSLKENYDRFKHSGLFALNLRFYIADKKVDPEIERTIKNDPAKFWYFNNGIIIVCDDYKINGDEIELRNYSIVNGGQTTRMIGEIPWNEDFCVFCKIIKNTKQKDSSEYAEFVGDVAQASNNQKPIKSEDLIANRKEQRLLKTRLAAAGVFVSIKRGDAAAANLKTNYPETWSRTKNTEIAQLLYAGVYQKPGTARNSKDKLFSNLNKYNLIFKNKEYDLDFLKNLLFIRSHYKKWSSMVAKDPNTDADKRGLSGNGMFMFVACTLLIAKLLYSERLVNEINKVGFSTEAGDSLLSQFTFNHKMFDGDFAGLEGRLFDLFDFIYDKYVHSGYLAAKRQKIDLIYSNFLKTDAYYKCNVANLIFDDLADPNNISPRLQKYANPLFHQEDEIEQQASDEMVEFAINKPDVEQEEPEEVEDPISAALTAKLTKYRETKYKEQNLKAYEVFTNKELKTIVKVKPKNIFQLLQFNCFSKKPRSKTKLYGQDIVNIVNSVIGG
jgi:hypothetical protein